MNVLDRDFAAEAPNQKWVTDITYLPTSNGWVYLAVVIDLFSRKVVGWSLSDSLETRLVSHALRSAIESRSPKRGELLHHSDRGCQYTSDAYQRTLRTMDITCSMSRPATATTMRWPNGSSGRSSTNGRSITSTTRWKMPG